MSTPANTRVEHRVAGADANPYLAMTAVLAGIHHGMTNQCDPGVMVQPGQEIDDEITLKNVIAFGLKSASVISRGTCVRSDEATASIVVL